MKLNYYPENDSLYIELQSRPGVETLAIAEGLNVDLDTDGHTVGIDIDHASAHLDLSSLEAVGFPSATPRPVDR